MVEQKQGLLDINKIKQDENARNDFITQYMPFIASFCSEICHRYVEFGVDDEVQIAMMAFNEAIDRFDQRGNFLLYSKVVMKARLLDYFKSSQYRERMNSYSLYDEEEKEIKELQQSAIENYEESYENSIRVAEIEALNAQLSEHGITFADLVKCSPKHALMRMSVNRLIEDIIKNKELCDKILKDYTLPLKEIEKVFLLPRKKIESYRKYIIAVIVIYHSDYEYLKGYLPIYR